jgi:hypothetical protein
MNAAQLNQVAKVLGTNDKNVVFSACLKTLIESGIAADAAFDFVFGEGAYIKFAGQMYDALRAA